MPRQPRYCLSGLPQHVLQWGNNRQAVFFSRDDYRFYLNCLRHATLLHNCDVHSYTLMDNHVHLLMTPHHPTGIAKVMQSIGRSYVRHINSKYHRTGTLWEGRYKACLVDADSYLLACYRYIELNPIRANIVKDAGDYPWSSYHWHTCGKHDNLITDHPLYQALGETDEMRQSSYLALCAADMDDKVLNEIQNALHQCLVLGNDHFKDRIEATSSLRARPGKRGRPKNHRKSTDKRLNRTHQYS